jgi:hypothetical protein
VVSVTWSKKPIISLFTFMIVIGQWSKNAATQLSRSGLSNRSKVIYQLLKTAQMTVPS